jgi:crotonobetainyl-CoA:carnitine CoA-transferase CaiB-like acyl-CoA transferase
MLDTMLPTGKIAKIPGLPLEMDGRKTRIRHQPPRMGADTRAVLEEAGFSREEVDRLVEQGIAITG